ncbi:hypothetical protein [Pseudomonas sp. TH31]|nr:hypothetical protein [Pseudomonas sp. TH31]MBK5413408.1 hypothetical protein [Pseudomonas sp. TH31]
MSHDYQTIATEWLYNLGGCNNLEQLTLADSVALNRINQVLTRAAKTG